MWKIPVFALIFCSSVNVHAAIWKRFVVLPYARCSVRFALMKFDMAAYDRFNDFFTDDTKMRVVETGGYEGVAGVTDEGPIVERFDFNFIGYNRKTGICEFLIFAETSHVSKAANTAGQVSFSAAAMSKIKLDLGKGKIKNLDVYMPRGFWEIAVKGLQLSDNTRKYVCGVMEGPCAPFLPVNSTLDCMSKLAALPYHTVGDDQVLRYEGNSQSCRALHASLAASSTENAKMHCPHTSFVPSKDPNGVVKCQVDSGYNYTYDEFFTKDELNQFTDFMISLGYDPAKGTDFVL